MVLNPTAALYVPCINVRSVNLLNLSEVVPIFYLSVIFSNAHVKKLHIERERGGYHHKTAVDREH